MKKEEDKARREFIKQEYLRRKQLKLMKDMDTLVKPCPAGAKQRKPRPKSIHRDVMESPRTPVRATAGKGAPYWQSPTLHALCYSQPFPVQLTISLCISF